MQFDDNDNDKLPRKPDGAPPRSPRVSLVIFLGLMAVSVALFFFDGSSSKQDIPYSAFLAHLQEGEVQSVSIIDQSTIHGTLKGKSGDVQEFTTLIPYVDLGLLDKLDAQDVRIDGVESGGGPCRGTETRGGAAGPVPARRARSMRAARPASVGSWNRSRSGSSIPKALRRREATRVASSE